MKYKIKHNKGISLILTLLVMAAILAIALGVSRLSLGEIKLIRDIPQSLIAYYAAEAGVERGLYEKRVNDVDLTIPDCSSGGELLDNGSRYSVTVTGGTTITIQANGCYGNIKRAIEVSF